MSLVKIQLRRDRSTSWAAATVLAPGEVGVETDTGRMKVGDGVRSWAFLPYTDGPLAQDVAGQKPGTIGQASIGTSTVAARADHSHSLPASPSFSGISVTGSGSFEGSVTANTVSASTFSGVTIGHVSGLQSQLNSKAAAVHNHQITSLDGFPSPQGKTGNALTWDGSSLVWATVAGSSTSITAGTGISVSLQAEGGYLVSLADTAVNGINVVPTSDPSNPVTLTGKVTIAAGANIQVEQSNGAITISGPSPGTGSGTAGVTGINSIAGEVTIAGATGGGITATTSGNSILLSAALPTAATTAASELGESASAGTSSSYARADHVHKRPNVNDLPISGNLNYSGKNVLYSNSFTASTAPSASSVEGMFAEVDGQPKYSDGSSWVTLAIDDHQHVIGDVSGLSDALDTIPTPGDFVSSVNGQSPDATGNVEIEVSGGSVSWDSISDRPTSLSYFTNDGAGSGPFITASGAPVQSVAGRVGAVTLTHTDIGSLSTGVFNSLQPGSGITVSQDSATSKAVLGLSAPAEPSTPPPTPSPDPGVQPGPSDPPSAAVFLQPQQPLQVGTGAVTILAVTEGFTTASFVWEISLRSDAEGDQFETILNDANISGQGTQSLVIDTLPEYALAKIRCTVTGLAGSANATISSAPVLVATGPALIAEGPVSPPPLPDNTVSTNVGEWLKVVISDGGYPYKRYRWLGSSSASDADARGAFGRGSLYQILQQSPLAGEQASESALGAIDPSLLTFVERQTDSAGFKVQSLYVKCVIDLYKQQPDAFSPGEPDSVLETDRILVNVYQAQANIITQPISSQVTSTGSASFFVEYDAPAEVEWVMHRRRADGSTEEVNVLELERPFTQASTVPSPGVYRNIITSNIVPGEYFGNAFQAIIRGGLDTIPVRSDRAILIGITSTVTSISVSGGNVKLVGDTPTITGTFIPRTSYRAVFESRGDSSSDWVELGAASVDTPLTDTLPATHSLTLDPLLASDHLRQYRLKVSNDYGFGYSDVAVISVRSVASTTDQMEDQVLAFGRGPDYEVDVPALADTALYITVKIEELERAADGSLSETGRVEFAAVDNGNVYDNAGRRLGALRYFAPGLQSSNKIRLGGNLSLRATCRVSLCAVNPFLTSTSGSLTTFGPFATWQGSVQFRDPGSFVYEAESYTIALDGSTFQSSSTLGVTVIDSAIIDIEQRRPITVTYGGALSGGAGVGALVLPDTFNFIGAANDQDKLLAFGVSYPVAGNGSSSYYLYSPDQGVTFETRRYTYTNGASIGSLRVTDCAYFDGRWWIAAMEPDGLAFDLYYSNASGTQWSKWGSSLPGYGSISVANGHMFVQGITYNPGDGDERYSSPWHIEEPRNTIILSSASSSPVLRTISGGNIKYIHGQYVTSTGAYGSSPTAIAGSLYPQTYGVGGSGSAHMDYVAVTTTGGVGFDYTLSYSNYGVFAPDFRDHAPGNWQSESSSFTGLNRVTNDWSLREYIVNRSEYWTYSTGPIIIGPQVGRYVYMQANLVSAGGPALVKMDAYNPNTFRIVESASGNESVWRNFVYRNFGYGLQVDFGGADALLHIGGYVYGPQSEAGDPVFGSSDPGGQPSQLEDRYLNGTDKPCTGDLIFTRDRVIKLYRPYLDTTSTTESALSGAPTRRF